MKAEIGDKSITIERDDNEPSIYSIDGKSVQADIRRVDQQFFHALVDNKGYRVELIEQRSDKEVVLKVNGKIIAVKLKDDMDLLLEKMGINLNTKKEIKELKAPMPGLVLEYKVEVGAEVNEGDPLVVLEAMKMENVLNSPTSGIVKSLEIEVGKAIDKNTIILTFE